MRKTAGRGRAAQRCAAAISRGRIRLSAILTDNGREYCGREPHACEPYLALNAIAHLPSRVHSPKTLGFPERFNRTVPDEFFRPAFRRTFHESVEQLRKDLDARLVRCNTERPHRGCRNRGKRPGDRVRKYLKNVRKEG